MAVRRSSFDNDTFDGHSSCAQKRFDLAVTSGSDPYEVANLRRLAVKENDIMAMAHRTLRIAALCISISYQSIYEIKMEYHRTYNEHKGSVKDYIPIIFYQEDGER